MIAKICNFINISVAIIVVKSRNILYNQQCLQLLCNFIIFIDISVAIIVVKSRHLCKINNDCN